MRLFTPLFLCVSFMTGCGNSAGRHYDVDFRVLNKTDSKFTDVAMAGDHYPGSFGNSVPDGNAVIVTRAPQLPGTIDVSWTEPTGNIQKTQFVFPAGIAMANSMEVVLEFTAQGTVEFYVLYAAGSREDAQGLNPIVLIAEQP